MNDPRPQDDIVAMIDAALDGALSDAECADLIERLRADAGARAHYRSRSQLHAMLHWVGRPMVAEADDTVESESLTTAANGAHRRRFRIDPAIAALAASIVILLTVGYVFWPSTEPDPEPTRDRGPVVGVLIGAESVQWGSDPIDTGEEVHGAPFTILGGTLEMQLNSGVELKVRGATTAIVVDPMTVQLRRGVLHARAPEGVTGFTVHAPGGLSVTDLGTVFEVQTEDDDRTVVSVSEGRVRVQTANGDSRIVSAGYAIEHTASTITAVSVAGESALAHRWTFNRPDGADDIGGMTGELLNGAHVENGRLVLDGHDDFLRTAEGVGPLTTKTLVAWVALANLEQQGGSALTIEQGATEDTFDAIVFGELTPRVWMAGSNVYARSQPVPQSGAPEEASPGETVTITIAYDADGTIRIYRNGQPYATHRAEGPVAFDSARVLIGKRHSRAIPKGAHLAGEIDEARIYNRALSDEEILMIHAQGPVPAAPDGNERGTDTSHQPQGDTR